MRGEPLSRQQREFVEKIVVHECSYDENKTRRQDIETFPRITGLLPGYFPAMKSDQRASRARRALPRWLRAFFSSRVSWAALLRMLSSQNRGS